MPFKKFRALQIPLALVILGFSASHAFSQNQQRDKSANNQVASKSQDAPKRARLIAVLGAGDLQRELEKPQARKIEKPISETAKGKVKASLRSGKEAFEIERKVFAIINQKRVDNGLLPLKWSEKMAEIARVHSIEMAEYNYFSHAGLDGSMVNDRADEQGAIDWKSIGENIAFNQGYENPAEFACESWMRSTSHHQNLMNKKWKESGVGVAITKDGRYYFTQVFVLNY